MNVRNCKLIFVAFIVGILALSGLTFAPNTADAQQEVTIRYSYFAPEWSFPGLQMQEWARELEQRVARRTDGEIQVNVDMHFGGELLGAADMWEGTRSGISDAGLSMPTYDPGEFPLLSVFSLPLHLPNSTVASQVVWDIIQEYEPESLDGFKILTAFTTEPSYIQTDVPIHSMDDLQGLEIRCAAAAVPICEALGIAATPMPMPEAPEALERGIIRGNVTSREVLKSFRLAEWLNYVVDYPTDVGVFVGVMNQGKWESLPPVVQKTIDELRREMTIWTGTYHDYIDNPESIRWSKKNHGLEITELSEEERQRWDEALDPIVQQWIDEHSDELSAQEIVNRVRELRDKYSEVWTIDLEE